MTEKPKGYRPRDDKEARDIEEEALYWREYAQRNKVGINCPLALLLLVGLALSPVVALAVWL